MSCTHKALTLVEQKEQPTKYYECSGCGLLFYPPDVIQISVKNSKSVK